MRLTTLQRRTLSLAMIAGALATLLLVGGCRSRTDRSAGPVVLTFGTFSGLPTLVSVTQADAAPPVEIQNFTLMSVVKDPNAIVTPAIEDVEVTGYQVVYARRDTGTRVPPVLNEALVILVPVNGNAPIINMPIMRLDQLLSVPLSDLANFGFDTETKTQVITLDLEITFFGHTLSGDSVQSAPFGATIEFVK